MQLIISLVVFACLASAEWIDGRESDMAAWPGMVLITIGCTLMVPLTAAFQVAFLQSVILPRQTRLAGLHAAVRRMVFAHLVIWIAFALAIVIVARWPAVVRQQWGLSRIPLLDDFLILLPVIVSLVASWAVFYRFQHLLKPTRNYWRSCAQFLALRFRTFFGIAILPVLFYTLSTDLGLLGDAHSMSSMSGSGTRIAASLLLAMFLFPLSMVWVLPTGRLPSPRFEMIRAECRRQRMRLFSIRVWNTGSQWANALVIGFVPGCRVLLVSDGLLQRFPENELLAIVRHEAGHVRLGHLPLRLALIMTPLASVAFLQWIAPSLLPIGLVAITYIAYLVWLVCWLSRKMEFEADLHASGYWSSDSRKRRPTVDNAADLIAALTRHARSQPSSARKKSLTHPPLIERIAFLESAIDDIAIAEKFVRQYRRSLVQLIAAVALASIAIPVAAVLLGNR